MLILSKYRKYEFRTTLPKSFSEISITLIPSYDKGAINKQKITHWYSSDYRYKNNPQSGIEYTDI